MQADEALLRLSRQARGTFGEMVDLRGGLPFLDWEKMVESGTIDNVKEITFKEDSITIKLHDAQSALVHVVKLHQLLEGKPTERYDVTVNDSREKLARLINRHADTSATSGDSEYTH